MLRIATKGDLETLRSDMLANFFALKQENLHLTNLLQELCPHKIVEEGVKNTLPGYKCKLCNKILLKKPKDSKILRIKEVLSDK